MIKSFDEIMEEVKRKPSKIIAVAAAHDEEVLKSLKLAKNMDLAEAVLIGDAAQIQQLCINNNIGKDDFHIVNIKNNKDAALRAVEMVRSGEADLLMKGILGTGELLKTVINKETGLIRGNLISHVTVIEAEGYDRLLLMTDAAININPTLEQKVEIIINAVELAEALDIKEPKVAALAAVELINEKMPATLDAAILTRMSSTGQLNGVKIDGPLALDNAVSIDAARHKGIEGEVAGNADILLVPNIESGNIFYKSLTYFAKAKVAGIVMGASIPIILTSRADSTETKLRSIALACYLK